MNHPLIELTKFPTMPAPFSSIDPGEAWVWGDFVLLLQVRPKLMAHAISAMTGQQIGPVPMEYPYAVTAFYRKDRNPHGPSSRPIAVATLEQADYAAIIAQMGGSKDAVKDLGLGESKSTVHGLFTAGAHLNFGDYNGPLTLDAARERLFDCLRSHLSLSGEPIKIGVMQDVHGHPNTGWPPQAIKPRKAGCLGVCLALGTAAILLVGLFLL
jgi:hypothetical protein